MSGYDIKKHVQKTLTAVTNASYGTLYPTLHKLLAEGSVAMQEIPQTARPSKKLYRITEQGRSELQVWLKEPPVSDQIRREFLLKVYLAQHLSKDDFRALLARRRDEAEVQLQALRQASHAPSSQWQKWVIAYALSQCAAEIEWLNQLTTEIEHVS